MERGLVLLDTSVLIDYFRKKDKKKSFLSKLTISGNHDFAVSVITEYEIFLGSTDEQQKFWTSVFSNFNIIELDSFCISIAVKVQKELKQENQMIAIPDLFIAATALRHNLKIATQNIKHFKRVKGLLFVEN